MSYSYSATDAPGSLANPVLPPGLPAFLQQELLQNEGAYGNSAQGTERAYANFTTGENYGRLLDRVGVDASFYTGGGALAGGRRVLLTDDASYAVDRLVTVLGRGGL